MPKTLAQAESNVEAQPSDGPGEPSEVPMKNEGDNLASQRVGAKEEAIGVASAIYHNDPEWKMQQTLSCSRLMTHFPIDLDTLEQLSGLRFANRGLVETSSAIASLAGGVVEVISNSHPKVQALLKIRTVTLQLKPFLLYGYP